VVSFGISDKRGGFRVDEKYHTSHARYTPSTSLTILAVVAVRGWRLIFLLVLVVATAAGVYLWYAYKRPLDMPAERVEVRVATGSSARSIARKLQQAGVRVD